MSEFKLELVNTGGNESLVSRFESAHVAADGFKVECIKAAERVVKNHKNKGLLLFLENSFESLVMLEAFLETGTEFEAVALSCGRVTSPVVTKWKDRLKDLRINLNEVRFDFENPAHVSEISSLQHEYQVVNVSNLLKMWVACHFDKYIVFSGDLCFPSLDEKNKVISWGLPDIRQLALYNFSKSFYVEPFFLVSTQGLFRAQTDSAFFAAMIYLHRFEQLVFLHGNFAARKIWYSQCGFQKLAAWPVSEEFESPMQSGLRFEDRHASENFFRIVERFRYVKHDDIRQVSEIPVIEPQVTAEQSAQFKELLNQLKDKSSDINTVGAVLTCPLKDDTSDQAFALFPYLMLQTTYSEDLKPIREHLDRQPFYNNSSHYITASDLHLHDELSGLVKFFEEKVRKYYEVQGKIVREIEFTRCWGSKAKAGEAQDLHSHPNSLLSGIFYLNEGVGGDTVFTKDLPENLVVQLPHKTTTPFNSLSVKVRPKLGKLVLFPSFLDHELLPHAQSQQPLYTIIFNVFVRDSVGSFTAGSWLDLRKL